MKRPRLQLSEVVSYDLSLWTAGVFKRNELHFGGGVCKVSLFKVVASCSLRVGTCGLEDRGHDFLFRSYVQTDPIPHQTYSQQSVPAQPFHVVMEWPDREANNPFL